MSVSLSEGARFSETPVPVESTAIPAGSRTLGLERLFRSGLGHLQGNRLRTAETCFLELVAADPDDWESWECLVRLYQALGSKGERDSALAVLRRMHQSGKSWGQAIYRDSFSVSGKTIKAYEIPSFDYPERMQIVFCIQDSAKRAARFLASVSRVERLIRPGPMDSLPGHVRFLPGFQLSFVTERKRRVYFIAHQKPGYSTMKKMLSNYLSGG